MKKYIAFALVFVLAISMLTSCGSDTDNSGDNNTTTTAAEGINDLSPEENNDNNEIDLSQFTPKELADSSLLEDWMKPEFGVITSGGETMKDFMYQFTVSGVTKANEESYRQLIEDNGFSSTSEFTYMKDGITIALGTAGIGTTSNSIMTVTIEKS